VRDIALTLVFLALAARALKRPDIGLNLFTWLSLMNPHRLCYGFALTFPFAQIAAVVTLIGLFGSKDSKKVPWTSTSILLIVFLVWMLFTTILSLHPEKAWVEFNLVWRIQLIAFLIMIITTTKERIQNLVWVMALSLAFYGLKGGVFTILSSGGARVWGPSGSFIGGNNEIGLALNMTIPLLRYLQLTTENRTVKSALTVVMLLTLVCVLGTQSRGALIGAAAMTVFLILKTRNKLPMLVLLAVSIPPILQFMPESWYARMNTVKTYEKDGSAMGRINAWKTAVSVANHRVFGGGYKCLHFGDTFDLYSPNPGDVHDAHSVYFEVLGEHGYVGLFLFLAIAFTAWRTAAATISRCRGDPNWKWASDLCAMIQVSLVGYFVGGAFLGLAMFDLYYDLIAVIIACNALVRKSPSTAEQGVALTPERAEARRSFVRPPVKRPAATATAP
jgi:probable O-glycosylation ligase (exosortase A-associated)